VLDPLYGYLLLGARMSQDPVSFATAYNFGPEPENELTVEELIQISIETWGSGSYEVQQVEGQLHEAGLLKLDITKAKTMLDWKPLLNAKETVSWTIDWYKTAPEDWEQKTITQVTDYLNRI
jgi:CDP-glucose 4,6-dehydratase